MFDLNIVFWSMSTEKAKTERSFTLTLITMEEWIMESTWRDLREDRAGVWPSTGTNSGVGQVGRQVRSGRTGGRAEEGGRRR